MPLIPSQYSNAVKPAYEKKNSARIITAQKKATAFSQFTDKGVTAMGGVPVTSHGISLLANQYVSTWEKNLPAKLGAKKEAKAEHGLLKGAITSGGKHGVGGWMSGDFNAYASQLDSLWDKLLKVSLMTMKEGKLKDTFVKGQLFNGKGVAPDFVPDISGVT